MSPKDYLNLLGFIICAFGIVLVLYAQILRLHLLLYPKIDAKFIQPYQRALRMNAQMISQTYDFQSSTHCPKCQGEFVAPSVRFIKTGHELVYVCKQCSASFALIPVTALKLCELIPDTWATSSNPQTKTTNAQ